MHRNRTLTWLLILTLAFIWGNSLLPRPISAGVSDAVLSVMNRTAEALGFGPELFTVMADVDGDGEEEPTGRLVRKMAHVFEFAVLGALLILRLGGGKDRFAAALALGIAAGAADETLQIFSNRGSQLRDVGIDAVGVLLGLGAVWLAEKLKKPRPEGR